MIEIHKVLTIPASMCTIFQIPMIYRNMQIVWINTQHVSLDFIQEISCYDFYKNTASNACGNPFFNCFFIKQRQCGRIKIIRLGDFPGYLVFMKIIISLSYLLILFEIEMTLVFNLTILRKWDHNIFTQNRQKLFNLMFFP